MGDLYRQNETMAVLGHQAGVFAGTDADRGIRDILTAYAECEEFPPAREVVYLLQKGILFSLLSNVYNLGVIAGKREERARKKPLDNRRD